MSSTIVVRNIPPKTLRNLKALAKRHNRSMEQEVRQLLEDYAVDRRPVIERMRKLRERIKPMSLEDVQAGIDEGRP